MNSDRKVKPQSNRLNQLEIKFDECFVTETYLKAKIEPGLNGSWHETATRFTPSKIAPLKT